MNPDEIQQLPLEIQRLEANKKAFDVPNLQLPSYDQIGKAKDQVFTKEGDKLVPRKPTFQEELKESARKMESVPDQMNPIAEYSRAQSEGYTNPLLPYDPTVDMNEVYARYDPTTWGDVAVKTWDTTVNNMWSGTQNIYYGLKEGITEGRVSAIWDNEYSKHLAEVTENMEKMNPMRFSQEEQGTTTAWLKQVLPSMGYVTSSVVEMAAQHVAFTLGGAAIGAVVGEGIGAVPGAIAGNIAAFAKDATTISNAVTNISRTARAVNALSTANKIKTGAQLFGYGLLSANGEAALNSQMAYHRALEEQKAAHFKETGQYLTGDGLKTAEDQAKKTGDVTMALNLPLIAATNIFEFGNVVRGKGVPQVIDKLAVKVNRKTGEAVATNTLFTVGGRYLKESASEGFEEFAQGVIEDASVNYFTQKLENRQNYLESFVDASYKRATSSEGLSDFAAGALIGGIGNAADLRGYSAVKSNSERFVNEYNNSVGKYFDGLGNTLRTNDQLKEAYRNGDSRAAREAYTASIADLVNRHASLGSTQAFSETLDALSDMDNAEFKKTFGVNISADEQAQVVYDVTQEYKAAAKQRAQVDTAFQVNPFEAESWFQRQINKNRQGFDVNKEDAAEVWDVFKNTLTSNLVKHGNIDRERQLVETEGQDMSNEFLSLTGLNVQGLVENKKADLRAKIAATLPGYARDQALLNKIEARTDIGEQYQEILNDADSRTPGIKNMVLEHSRHLQQEKILLSEVQRLNTPAGQRREIKKIIDWKNWYETKIGTAPIQPTAVPSTAVAPAQPAPVATQQPVPQVPTSPVIQEPATVQEQPAAPEPVATEVPVVPETPVSPVLTDVTEEELNNLYGEGKGDDFVPEASTTTSNVPAEEPRPIKQVQAIEPDLPEDLQVNEAALPDAVDNMEDGDAIVPEQDGLEVTFKGEPVKKITKEKGKVKVEKEDGKQVELSPSAIPLLRTEKAADSPVTDVAGFIAQNGLTGEKADLLRSLANNNYVEIVCA